jgi:FlaA1/EpsC-like NDP-sugar epimerase
VLNTSSADPMLPSTDRGRPTLLGRMPRSTGPLLVLDVVIVCAAYALTSVLVRDAASQSFDLGDLVKLLPAAAGLQLLVGLVMGSYLGRWRVGTFGEAGGLLAVTTIATAGTWLVNQILDPHPVPRSVPVLAGFIALVGMGVPRAIWRLRLTRSLASRAVPYQRVVLLGAGEGAFYILPFLLAPDSPYRPVALLDDDPTKRFRRIHGIPVVGSCKELSAVSRRLRAEVALIAVPSADGDLVRRLVGYCDEAGIEVKVLPHISELVGGLSVGDIRAVSEADVLGRRATQLDLDAMAENLHGKRVLITGAGGSIGSELSRQVFRFGPSELTLLDRDESALHGVMLTMTGQANLDADTTVLCDIRDRDAVRKIFAERRPEVVFHAAALKHVNMLERFPDEALKTNVVGTLNILDAAVEFGTERFINISTDKAANPENILGYSKRLTECLTSRAAAQSGKTFVSVRFGNVLGSRGSMLETFRKQVANGGPITVTDPDVTRYFMMVEEAVALTIQSAAIGRAGEVLILDMGEPVLIEDVAKMMASGSPRNIEIIYTGLRPGEKLHELLIGEGEIDDRPFHPEITQTLVPAISEDSLATLLAHEAPLSARPLMEKACGLAKTTPATTSDGPSRPVAEPAHAN